MIGQTAAQQLCAVTRKAGERILQLRDQGNIFSSSKIDGSPVTCADHESQAILLEGLRQLTPDIPVIAEEQDHSNSPTNNASTYWLVDPLDGTRDYISGRNDFSVNVGLIHNGRPVFGIVYAPARDDLVCGGLSVEIFRVYNGVTSQLLPISASTPPRLVVSVRDERKNPLEQWLAHGIIAQAMVYASAYKLALVATGEADLFLRTSVTFEWDTAAGDAILRALGGVLLTPEGHPLAYNKPRMVNGSFIAYSAPQTIVARQFLSASGLNWTQL